MNTTKTSPKDFFLHLGATIALYVSAVTLIGLIFSIADRLLPDALDSYGYWDASALVWPISILVVLVPVLYAIEWSVSRDIARMPEKRDVWIRRWRIYLTLFLTGAAIAGDMVALINTYLNGEITARFVYKVLAVLVVSAVIFAYYILSKSAEQTTTVSMWRKVLMWLGGIFAVASVVGGFLIVGSPAKQRSMRFDQERMNDLSNLQYEITDRWQSTGRLPDSLQALNDQISSYSIPKDPETGADYGYAVKGATSFQLCATFALPSAAANAAGSGYTAPPIRGGNDNWTHPSGKACFDRTIDPELYPPTVPVRSPAKNQ